jgi:uncharacterized protein (DUF1810 family)
VQRKDSKGSAKNGKNAPTADASNRFLEAQAAVWDSVIEELQNGRKETHWMWFVFPQIAGLGRSRISQRYAIARLNAKWQYRRKFQFLQLHELQLL